MKSQSALHRFLACLPVVVMFTSFAPRLAAQVAIIWDGPTLTYTQPGQDPTQAENQDRLTDNVWLTRGAFQGLFNAAVENVYTHDFSPAGTEWAFGSLSDYASLSYADWETWNGSRPPDMVGQAAVVHLIADDIYLSIQFTSWGQGTGGFSYIRSTPVAIPEPGVGAIMLLGLIVGLWLRQSSEFEFGR